MVIEGDVFGSMVSIKPDLNQLAHLRSACLQAVSRKNLEISVDMSELLEVIDVVLVGLNVKTKIHASELVKFAHVNIIAEIISSQVSLLFAVLLDPLKELIELLLSLEDVHLLRLDLFCLCFFKILSGAPSIFPKVCKSLSLKSLLLLDLYHVFLELLAKVQFTIVPLGPMLSVILH